MYKETVKRSSNSIFFIVGLIILIFICMTLLDFIATKKYTAWIDLASIIILTILAYFILKYKVADISYVLIDTELIFQRIIGKDNRVILNVNVSDILLVAPSSYEELKQYDNIEKTYNLCGKYLSKNKYLGIFIKDGKKHKFVFEPSERLVELLEKSIPNKVIK